MLHRLPGHSKEMGYRRSGLRLNHLYWLEVYDAIRGVMGYSWEADAEAATVLEELLYQAKLEGRLVSLEELCSILQDPVCIAGGSIELEQHVLQLYDCGTVIAVDGATSLLHSCGIQPSVVVTDLDGSWNAILEASRRGAIVVVHGHGDNIHALKLLVPRLDHVMGTVQYPPRLGLAYVLGGFTDGDRAVALTLACGRVPRLYGMKFTSNVGWWSKPWLKTSTTPWPSKRRKLEIGARLTAAMLRAFKIATEPASPTIASPPQCNRTRQLTRTTLHATL